MDIKNKGRRNHHRAHSLLPNSIVTNHQDLHHPHSARFLKPNPNDKHIKQNQLTKNKAHFGGNARPQGKKQTKKKWEGYFKIGDKNELKSEQLGKGKKGVFKYEASKTEFINHSENYFTSLSFDIKKGKKECRKRVNKQRNKKTKSAINQLYQGGKRKCFTPTEEMIRPSKLVTLNDCSLPDFQNDYQQQFPVKHDEYCITFEQQSTAVEEQIKYYQQTYKISSNNTSFNEENSKNTESLIQKYINPPHRTSKISTNQEKSSLWNSLKKVLSSVQQENQEVQLSIVGEQIGSSSVLKKFNKQEFEKLCFRRCVDLQDKKTQEFSRLGYYYEMGKLSQLGLTKEKNKIWRWIQYQKDKTEAIKNYLNKGFNQAYKILKKQKLLISDISDLQVGKLPRWKSLIDLKQSIQDEETIKEESQQNSESHLVQVQSEIKNGEIIKQEEDDGLIFLRLHKIDEKNLSNLTKAEKQSIADEIVGDLCSQIVTIGSEQFNGKLWEKITTKTMPNTDRKGFKCGRLQIMDFIDNFTFFIEHQKAFKENMIRQLKVPLGPSPQQMLKYMREVEQEPSNKPDQFSYVFDLRAFDICSKNFVQNKDYGRYFANDDGQKKRVNFLQKAEYVHHKAIFDCMNQAVDKFRPYGMLGPPFPWKSRIAGQEYESIEEVLKKIKEEISDHCLFLCGAMTDKEGSFFEGFNLSREQLENIREDRLSRMLGSYVLQTNTQWVFFDDEETELQLSLSQAVYELLIKEAIDQFFIL